MSGFYQADLSKQGSLTRDLDPDMGRNILIINNLNSVLIIINKQY